MALIVSGIASKLAQFSNHVIGPILGRWRQNPQYLFSDLYMIYSVASVRFKYIPYSNKIRVVFASEKYDDSFLNLLQNDYLTETKHMLLDPTSPEVTRVMCVLVKIIRALSDGLRLQRDCRVSANVSVVKIIANTLSRRDSERTKAGVVCFDRPGIFGDMKYNTEHLDGLNWEVMVIESDEYHASYHGNGRIFIHTGTLCLSHTDDELASVLAHELGHGVAMHMKAHPLNAVLPFAVIPWVSAFWGTAIFVRLFDLILYTWRRNELEADYIGLMLMASAGYDPRFAPKFWKKYDYLDKYALDTTHPSYGRRAQMLSQDTVMDKAVKIYEQVRAGHGVPSFIEKGEKILCSRDFSPF